MNRKVGWLLTGAHRRHRRRRPVADPLGGGHGKGNDHDQRPRTGRDADRPRSARRLARRPGDHPRPAARARDENTIGRSELVCTFVDSGRSRSCRGTYILPKGKIVVGGSLLYRQFYDLAVLGGTGLYDNARGTVTVTRTSPQAGA